MKKQIGLLSMIAGTVVYSLSSLGNVPVIRNVEMTQDQLTRLVTITYEVLEAPGIVTLDIQTNGVSIGAENIQYLAGDVNTEVVVGSHTITWRPDKSWPGHKVDQATAKISIWDRSFPPNYMSVNLVEGGKVQWYTSEKSLPGGIGNDLYRGTCLLMRRICQPNGGVWVMGSPLSGEGWRNGERETLHEVVLTNDYWIGVFEITQKQWDLIKGGQPSAFQGPHWASRPVEQVSCSDIRGAVSQYQYPARPDPNSFIGKLRDKTGIQMFDLPTEMQWEYACRAGTETALNSGASLMNPSGNDSEMNKVGRYLENGGQEEKTARVGSYQPNAWGIYDMHGNVCEWCLDDFSNDISGLKGDVNITTGGDRVRRGGSWLYNAASCRSAYRDHSSPSSVFNVIGFRVVCFR